MTSPGAGDTDSSSSSGEGPTNTDPASSADTTSTDDTSSGESSGEAGSSTGADDQPPSSPVVEIGPADPTTLDDLVVTVNVEDPEGDPLTYEYTWTVDGVPWAGTESTVAAADTTKGQTWAVTVTVSDGTTSLEGQASTSVVNSPPEVTMLTLTPDLVFTDDVLSGAAETSDADGDAVTVSWRWTVNDVDVDETGSLLDGAVWFDKGDSVVATAIADDGEDLLELASDAIVVANTAPQPPMVAIAPATLAIGGGQDAVCQVADAALDADGDPLSYAFSWVMAGADYPADFPGATGPTTTTFDGDTFPAEDLVAGDLECSVVVSDDDGASAGPVVGSAVVGSLESVGYLPEYPGSSVHGANFLLGHPITLPLEATALEIGIIAKQTASNAKIAIYTDAGGQPGSLVVGTGLQPIAVGTNTFPIDPTVLPAGAYWLMAVYDAVAYIGEGDSGTVYYRSMSAGAAFPDPIGGLSAYTGGRHNYFVNVVF